MRQRSAIRPPRARTLPAALAACLFAAGCGGGTPATTPKPAAPQILGFTVADAQVVSGTGTTLTAYFTGGTGTVDGGVGAVNSGTPVAVTPDATTTYTLTVKGDGGTTTATAQVTVVDGASLTVTFSGAVPPSPGVVVAGPGGPMAILSETTTLTGLAPGVYQVTASPTVVQGVGYLPSITGAAVALAAGGTGSAEVTWIVSDSAPTIAPVADQFVIPQAPTVVHFTVSDAQDPPSALTVTATSADTTILPASALVLGGTGADRTLAISHQGTAGWTAVTLAVTDTAGNTTTQSFPVEVAQVVTTTADAGAGSLRAVMGAAPDGSAVAFATGLTGKITLTSGVIPVTHHVLILGPGAGVLALDGGGTQGLFEVKNYAVLEVAGLTFQNAAQAIVVDPGGTLRAHDAAFVANKALLGAAIYDLGTATVTRSLFQGNVASCGTGCSGGGAAVDVGSSAGLSLFTVSDSTFTGNVARDPGGAIAGEFSAGGALTVQGCTVAGNLCQGSGCAGGAIRVTTLNPLGHALPAVEVSITGSIVAGNTGGSTADLVLQAASGAPIDVRTQVNVLGALAGLTPDATDVTGVTDPMLSALGDHGGPTETLIPLPGSPALGLVPLSDLGTDTEDQRGDTRRAATGSQSSDAGAVDRQPGDPSS